MDHPRRTGSNNKRHAEQRHRTRPNAAGCQSVSCDFSLQQAIKWRPRRGPRVRSRRDCAWRCRQVLLLPIGLAAAQKPFGVRNTSARRVALGPCRQCDTMAWLSLLSLPNTQQSFKKIHNEVHRASWCWCVAWSQVMYTLVGGVRVGSVSGESLRLTSARLEGSITNQLDTSCLFTTGTDQASPVRVTQERRTIFLIFVRRRFRIQVRHQGTHDASSDVITFPCTR